MAAAPMNARMFQTFIATALAAGHIGLALKIQKPDAPDSRESGKGRGRVKKKNGAHLRDSSGSCRLSQTRERRSMP
jgi:hypothetical protein